MAYGDFEEKFLYQTKFESLKKRNVNVFKITIIIYFLILQLWL